MIAPKHLDRLTGRVPHSPPLILGSRARFLNAVGALAIGAGIALSGPGACTKASAATPQETTVNPEMNINWPYPGSIQEAVDTYDIVYFAPGTYSKNNDGASGSLPAGIYVTQRGATLIGLLGPNGEKPYVRNLQVDLRTENPNGRDATLRNFSISRIAVISACHDLTIENCDFPEPLFNFFYFWFGAGRRVERPWYLDPIPGETLSIDGTVAICNCVCRGDIGCGVWCTDWGWSGADTTAVTADFVIENNTLTGNIYGVLFFKQHESSTFAPRVAIRDNRIEDNYMGVGLWGDTSSYPPRWQMLGEFTIQRNEIRGGVGLDVEAVSGPVGFCRNNLTVTDLSFYGIPAGAVGAWSPELLICENRVRMVATTPGFPVYLDAIGGTVLRNNTLQGMCYVGVCLGGVYGDPGSVSDCVCIGNNVSRLECEQATFYVGSRSWNNVVKGNTGTVIDESPPGSNFLTGLTPMNGAPPLGPAISPGQGGVLGGLQTGAGDP